jgi:lysophospholipase L1-like esterase
MNRNPLPFLLLAALLHAPQSRALDINASGGSITVSSGKADVGGKSVTVTQAVTLPIAAAPVLNAENEALTLSVDKPVGYAKGTKLRACNARDVNAAGSFVPGSLVIKRTQNGEPLKLGEDYLVDEVWGLVGLGPKSQVTAKDTVLASYQYSMLRMDTVQVSAEGKASVKQGKPHISAPVPPDADAGQVAIAHVFVNYRDTAVKADQIYLITETAAQAITASKSGRLPKAMAKLKAGQPVTIVCWGDSVTAGGNASKPEFQYVDVFAAGLRKRFPQSKIEVKNISAGGSNSRQWLSPEQFAYRGLKGADNPARLENVLATKPDVVTIEFVNDAGLKPDGVEAQYSEILERLNPTGAEVVLITPHFTMLKMMGFQSMREAEKRPYVLGLRAFAEKHHIALADASARWEHLAKEGLPYLTLLHNTINHPDDRGHLLFAEELWKCFE